MEKDWVVLRMPPHLLTTLRDLSREAGVTPGQYLRNHLLDASGVPDDRPRRVGQTYRARPAPIAAHLPATTVVPFLGPSGSARPQAGSPLAIAGPTPKGPPPPVAPPAANVATRTATGAPPPERETSDKTRHGNAEATRAEAGAGDPVAAPLLRELLDEVLLSAANWAGLQSALNAMGFALRIKGGGLVLHSWPDDTFICKSAKLGFSYAELIGRLGRGEPPEPASGVRAEPRQGALAAV